MCPVGFKLGLHDTILKSIPFHQNFEVVIRLSNILFYVKTNVENN